MSGIELSLTLRRTEVISGESLALQAVVINLGTQPAELQISPYSDVTYEFRSAEDGALRYTTSSRAYLRGITAGLQLPPLTPTKVTLAPGQSRKLREDPALYLMQPLVPGKYLLSARLAVDQNRVESPAIALQVVPARISHSTLFYCPYQVSMVCVFDHRDQGGAWVFHRETEGEALTSGIAMRRQAVGRGVQPQDVTAALHVGPRLEGRWLAWLEEGALGALRVWGQAVTAKPPLIPIELAQPRLVQPGFHLSDGSAAFLVAGMAAGRARLQAVTLTPDKGVASAPAPLFEIVPQRVLACWTPGGAEARVMLVWADARDSETRVFLRPFSLSGKPLAAGPKQIYARQARLLALELNPLPEDPPGCAHALFEPHDHSGRLAYMRIPLAGAPQRPEEFDVPAPPQPASAWAISGLQTGGLLVLACLGDRIWVASARGREWAPLTGALGEVRHLRLAASTGGYWGALWADPASGLRWASDPNYRARA